MRNRQPQTDVQKLEDGTDLQGAQRLQGRMHVPKKGYGDCERLYVRPRFEGEVCMTLTRQFRDLFLSVAGLSLLVMLLLSLNPRLRERAIAFSTSLSEERVVSGQGGEIEGHGFV